jgi:hypothetical protein
LPCLPLVHPLVPSPSPRPPPLPPPPAAFCRPAPKIWKKRKKGHKKDKLTTALFCLRKGRICHGLVPVDTPREPPREPLRVVSEGMPALFAEP